MADNRIYIIGASGGGGQGGLTDGSNVPAASNSVFVYGAEDWAERVDVSGDRWSDHGGHHFSEHALELEKLANGKHRMTETYHWRSHVYTKQVG